jgi:hypothetical protein
LNVSSARDVCGACDGGRNDSLEPFDPREHNAPCFVIGERAAQFIQGESEVARPPLSLRVIKLRSRRPDFVTIARCTIRLG